MSGQIAVGKRPDKAGGMRHCFLKIITAMHLPVLMAACVLMTSCSAAEKEEERISFSFTGGTGRVKIECLSLEKSDEGCTAAIVFDSPNYQYVRINDSQYDRLDAEGIAVAGITEESLKEKYGEEYSVFAVPAPENGTLDILAMTTAMSTPHEISYRLFFGDAAEAESANEEDAGGETGAGAKVSFISAGDISGLSLTGDMETEYAHCFTVHEYEDGYRLIDIADSAQYLLVPEGKEVPEGLPDEIKVLKAPLDRIYLAASNAMSLFFAMGGEADIALTGLDADGWQIEGPAERIAEGTMKFAGRYSAPDYEMLIRENCNLAIENTMILHSPEVIEKIEALGIPVMIDRSSYETHPLGRCEWIRLYGVLCGCEDAADAFFDSQVKEVKEIEARQQAENKEDDGKVSVAFFALTTQGTVTVRRADDYIAQMIEIAGASYAFYSLKKENTQGGTETISMEEFYATAESADYLIYNAAIANPIKSREELISMDALFEDFKAVKEDRVYQVGKNLYQSSDIAGMLIRDIYLMRTEAGEAGMTFLEKLP